MSIFLIFILFLILLNNVKSRAYTNSLILEPTTPPISSKYLEIHAGRKKSKGILGLIITYLKDFFKKYIIITKDRYSKKKYNFKPTEKSQSSNRRIQREIKSFKENPPDNCKLIVGNNIRSWRVEMIGAKNTIYENEKYNLKLIFPKEYPSKPPSVYFLKPCPRHTHVYTNGDICLNFLGKDWRPSMTAQTLVISIYSMLSSAREKKIPQDNALHADSSPGQNQDNWMYHDDRC